MPDLLILLLPLILLVFIVRHVSPIKAILSRVKTVLPPIFVTDLATAHRLLVRGATGGSFSNRTPSFSPSAILSRRRYQNITSAPYGQCWHAMRQNLTTEDLAEQRRMSQAAVHAADSIRYAMFGLVATMCFGDGLDRGRIRAMADAQGDLVKSLDAARLFAYAKLPAVTRLIYRKQWNKLAALRQKQEETYLPLIHSRRGQSRLPPAYVDTLIDLHVPEDDDTIASEPRGQRRISDGESEMVGMCSEFLGAGTEPTASALQWTMANLVKRPDIQDAVRREIHAVVAADAEEVRGCSWQAGVPQRGNHGGAPASSPHVLGIQASDGRGPCRPRRPASPGGHQSVLPAGGSSTRQHRVG
ncbi:hypothetical protein ACQ4PT_067912 [Festuca glaucescens]